MAVMLDPDKFLRLDANAIAYVRRQVFGHIRHRCARIIFKFCGDNGSSAVL